MATQFQVNLQLSAGMDFYQEFYLAESDLSPLNITGIKFYSTIKKHSSAVIAHESTSTLPKQNYISFETGVVDELGGVYYLKLADDESEKLEEGKYVYSTVMRNLENEYTEVNSGLIFVDRAFGVIKNQEEEVVEDNGIKIEPPDPDSGGGEGSISE